MGFEDDCTEIDTGEDYDPEGIYPEFTFCTKEVDVDSDNTINCVPLTPPKEDNVSNKRHKAQQYGYRVVPAMPALNIQHGEHVFAQVGISSGSVAAPLRSSDRSFVISPHKTLTANLSGFNFNLCRSSACDTKHGRDSNRTNQLNSKVGDEVDFTFGLSVQQGGILFYLISGV